jgi:RHH-type proline utilization regulon transcriptional repressor/proline dehydrogenase/delta 1-pyrroline-5-carboxylate dehydrogenase
VAHLNRIAEEAINLAETWQNRANALMNSREKARHRRLAGLLAKPLDKVFLVKLIDQSFRSRDKRRVADQIHSLMIEHGIPKFFTPPETLLMYLFLHVGRFQ